MTEISISQSPGIWQKWINKKSKKIESSVRALELYGVCRWIKNLILPQIDILKFEISLLEAEKFNFQMLIKSTKNKDFDSNIMV